MIFIFLFEKRSIGFLYENRLFINKFQIYFLYENRLNHLNLLKDKKVKLYNKDKLINLDCRKNRIEKFFQVRNYKIFQIHIF